VSDDDRKLSWKEIDQRRDGSSPRQEGRRPRNEAERERSEQATQAYISEIDKLFSSGPGGAEGEELVKAIRDAHGTSELDAACQAYRDAAGLPRDLEVLSIFLDCKDTTLVVKGLEAVLELQKDPEVSLSRGLQSQLRLLAQSFDNTVAEIAEEIIEGF
jgi:hypothetical protein